MRTTKLRPCQYQIDDDDEADKQETVSSTTVQPLEAIRLSGFAVVKKWMMKMSQTGVKCEE